MYKFVEGLHSYLGHWLTDHKGSEQFAEAVPTTIGHDGPVPRSITFRRISGCVGILPEFELWVSKHLQCPIEDIPGCPAVIIMQTSGPRSTQEEEFEQVKDSLRKTHPWICLVVLRYGSLDVQKEDFSKYGVNASFRFMYYTSGIHNGGQNEDSWIRLKQEFEKYFQEEELKSTQPAKIEKPEKKSLRVIRIRGSEDADPDFEKKLSLILDIPVSRDSGKIPIVIVQASGPRISQDNEVRDVLTQLRERNHKIILISLRFSTSEKIESEPQNFPCDLYLRFLYSTSKGVWKCVCNDNSYGQLKNFIENC